MANKVAVDDQTGKVYEIVPEKQADTNAARFSLLYLLLMMLFFFWLLFDTWIRQYSLANLLRYPDIQLLSNPSFRLAVYAFIGGALGAIVNGIRSVLIWHAERSAFGSRFVWKYITAPFLGAALALFTYALIRGGVAVLGGDTTQTAPNLVQTLTTFGVGVLAGYGAQKVFVWLDAQVSRIFQVPPSPTVSVPSLTGKTREEAEELLKASNLKLGEVSQEDQDDAAQAGKVIRQTPQSATEVASGALVNITLARLKAPPPNH